MNDKLKALKDTLLQLVNIVSFTIVIIGALALVVFCANTYPLIFLGSLFGLVLLVVLSTLYSGNLKRIKEEKKIKEKK